MNPAVVLTKFLAFSVHFFMLVLVTILCAPAGIVYAALLTWKPIKRVYRRVRR